MDITERIDELFPRLKASLKYIVLESARGSVEKRKGNRRWANLYFNPVVQGDGVPTVEHVNLRFKTRDERRNLIGLDTKLMEMDDKFGSFARTMKAADCPDSQATQNADDAAIEIEPDTFTPPLIDHRGIPVEEEKKEQVLEAEVHRLRKKMKTAGRPANMGLIKNVKSDPRIAFWINSDNVEDFRVAHKDLSNVVKNFSTFIHCVYDGERDIKGMHYGQHIKLFQKVQALQVFFEELIDLYDGKKKKSTNRLMKSTTPIQDLQESITKRFKLGSVRNFRRWVSTYIANDFKLVEDRRGRHEKRWLMNQEHQAQLAREWVRAHANQKGTANMRVYDFMGYCNDTLLVHHVDRDVESAPKSITLETARKWLMHLGFFFRRDSKNVYYDGHEREDVVQYRNEFVPKLLDVFDRSNIYGHMSLEDAAALDPAPSLEWLQSHTVLSDDGRPVVEFRVDELEDAASRSAISPEGGVKSLRRPAGEKPTLAIFQDEVIYKCHSEEQWSWQENGVITRPKKKTEGRGVMLSSYVSELGFIKITEAEKEGIDRVRAGRVPGQARPGGGTWEDSDCEPMKYLTLVEAADAGTPTNMYYCIHFFEYGKKKEAGGQVTKC